MSTKAVTTFLLSSLIYGTTHAFVALDVHPSIDNNAIQPLPSDLDTVHWVPIATLEPISITPSPASSVPAPTPFPVQEENEYHILPLGLDANAVPELKVRQVTGQGAAAAPPTAINQISPITTYYINKVIAPGQVTQVPVVYTQTFAPIPDQWPSAGAGTIGLGTISGTVGQVRSKRSLPTQAPLAEDKPLKKGSVDEDVKFAITTHMDAVPLQNEQEAADSPAFANDARRALQAGTLAVLAVGIATICVSYL